MKKLSEMIRPLSFTDIHSSFEGCRPRVGSSTAILENMEKIVIEGVEENINVIDDDDDEESTDSFVSSRLMDIASDFGDRNKNVPLSSVYTTDVAYSYTFYDVAFLLHFLGRIIKRKVKRRRRNVRIDGVNLGGEEAILRRRIQLRRSMMELQNRIMAVANFADGDQSQVGKRYFVEVVVSGADNAVFVEAGSRVCAVKHVDDYCCVGTVEDWLVLNNGDLKYIILNDYKSTLSKMQQISAVEFEKVASNLLREKPHSNVNFVEIILSDSQGRKTIEKVATQTAGLDNLNPPRSANLMRSVCLVEALVSGKGGVIFVEKGASVFLLHDLGLVEDAGAEVDDWVVVNDGLLKYMVLYCQK